MPQNLDQSWLDAASATAGKRTAASLYDAAQYDPDEEAKRRKIARRAGLPVETVRNAPREAELEAERRALADLDSRLRSSPRASAWLSRDKNAAVARDDVSILTRLERSLLGVSPIALGASAGTAIVKRATDPDYYKGASTDFSQRGVVRALGAGAAGAASGIAGAVEAFAEVDRAYSPRARWERKVAGRALTDGLTDLARRRRQGWARLQWETRPDAKSQFGRDVLGGIESVPVSLGAAGVTLLTRNPAAGASMLGGIEGAQGYGDARTEGAA